MYIKTFKLKQHTPMIHFQSGEKGATLRASEVKPKLDKFLIKKFEKEGISFEQWQANDKHQALDYGMRIICGKVLKKGETTIIPPDREKWIISENIQLTIRTVNKHLLKQIEENIKEFFILHNFGKRQSKGFGSFTCNIDNVDEFEKFLKQSNKVCFKSNSNLQNNIQKDDFFYRKISKQWSRLKSGKNHNGYEKSRVFQYLRENNLRWDKRFVKKKLKKLIDEKKLPKDLKAQKKPIDIDCKNRWEDITHEEYRFGRAMLGLAEHYEFRAYGQYLYNVKIKGDGVERFKSPMTFKIFKNCIYIILETIPLSLFDKEFSFSVMKKKNRIREGKDIDIDGTLKTPSKNEFSLEKFAKKYLRTIGYKKI